MPKLRNFEIFKPGTFTAMDGRKFTFTEQDLHEIADSYDPNLYQANLTLGHPKNNLPDLGAVHHVYMYQGKLFACAEFADELAEAIHKGTYKHRSASFYLPHSPENPVKGKKYLRHIGFLGAMPPAVKGLASIDFSESGFESSINFASSGEFINLADYRHCDTQNTIKVRQKDGTFKTGFIWRGEILYI